MSTTLRPDVGRLPDLMRMISADAASFSPEPGLRRRVLAHNEKMMLVEHRMEPAWIGTRHSHPHDQLVYIVEGRLRICCGDDEFEARAGDSFVVRGGVEHSARALGEPAVVLDVFTPYREDYLPTIARTSR